MRTLIYKRTHPGDPDNLGRFGIQDCMGRVRDWAFDAVIGVGGLGAEASSHNLDNKINWIGIGARKAWVAGARGPLVTFDHFVLYEDVGPSFTELAPVLARRVYSTNVRVLMDGVTERERREVSRLLALAANAPPSQAESDICGSGAATCEGGCCDVVSCHDAPTCRPKTKSHARRHNVRCS